MEIERRKSLYGFEYREPDMRRKEGRKLYDIKQLWQRNHEILRLALLGHKNTEIAKILNISTATVSLTLNSNLGMHKLSEMRKDRDAKAIKVAEEVAKLFPKALAVYDEILSRDSSEVSFETKLKAANTVLMDLGGHKAPTKIQGQFAHAHLTREDIEEIKRRALTKTDVKNLPE